jgi:hypothetical protein
LYKRPSASPIEGAENAGFSVASGPKLFDELAQEMADDVLEINNASAKVLFESFCRGYPEANDGEQLLVGEEIELCNQKSRPDEVVVSRVTVDSETAVCQRTGAKLILFQLEDEDRKKVHDTLIAMARSQHEEFMVKLKARFKERLEELDDEDYAVRAITNFSRWLE